MSIRRRRQASGRALVALALMPFVTSLVTSAALASVRGGPEAAQRQVVAVHKCAAKLWKGAHAAQVPLKYALPTGLRLPPGAAVYGFATLEAPPIGPPLLYVAGPDGSSCSADLGNDGALGASLTPSGQDQPTLNFTWIAGGTCISADFDGAFFHHDACRVPSGPYLPRPMLMVPTPDRSYQAGFTTIPPGYQNQWLGPGGSVFYTTDVVAIGDTTGKSAEAASCALPVGEQDICDVALALFVDQSFAATAKPPFSGPLIAAVWRLVAAAHRQRREHAQPAPPALIAALRLRAGQPKMDVYVYYNTFSRAWVEFVAVLPSNDTGGGIAHYVNGRWVVVSGPGGGGLLCGAPPGAVPPKVLGGFAFIRSLQCSGDR